MDDIWEKIPIEAREEWAVHQAANDPKIQAIFSILIEHDMNSSTVELVKDGLEGMLEHDYGILPEHSHKVFSAAEALAREGTRENG